MCAAIFFAIFTDFFLVDAKTRACPPVFRVFKTRFMVGSRVFFSIFLASPSLYWISSCRSTPSLRVTGRHSVTMYPALSQPAISSTLWMVALKAKTCMSGLTCMSRASTTSSVGPRSPSFKRWTSSATTSEMSSIHLTLCLRSESAFSLVVTMMSYLPSQESPLSKSPVLMPTLTRLPFGLRIDVYFLNSSYFSFAKARRGDR